MDAQWLKKQFSLHPGKTKGSLAKALGLEPSAISKILANGRQIKAHEFAIMQSFFHPQDFKKRENQDLLDNPDVRNTYANYSLQDTNATHEDWINPKQKHQTCPQSSNTSFQGSLAQLQIIKVTEDLMAPEFRIGNYITIDTKDCSPEPPGFFMISDGFTQLLRHCKFCSSADKSHIVISAHCKNFQAQTIDKQYINIIGRVIAKLDWV